MYGNNEKVGANEPIKCNVYLYTCLLINLDDRWLISCKTIEEVRLDGNLLGDSAAREILIGLKCRKEGNSMHRKSQ